jgi:hypothetical protein
VCREARQSILFSKINKKIIKMNIGIKQKSIMDNHLPAKRVRPLKNGQRPIARLFLPWDKHPEEIPVNVLIDLGATAFIVSEVFVQRHNIQIIQRQCPGIEL